MRRVVFFASVLAALLVGVVHYNWLDPRPVQKILYLGDSYTYYNDMPEMVAKMADSAHSPIRYDITMNAFPSATLEEHWKNGKTRQLLSKGGWYRILAQPEGALSPRDADSPMFVYGRKLLRARADQPPAIVISWQATDNFTQKHYSMSRSAGAALDQDNLRRLAIDVGADVIDIAQVWDAVNDGTLPFSLYKDGNHPSLQGSYLAALVVYAGLTYSDVKDVTYVPWGMDADEAALLRQKVQAALPTAT